MVGPAKLFKSKKVIFLTGEGMCGKSTMALFISHGDYLNSKASYKAIETGFSFGQKKIEKSIEQFEKMILSYLIKYDKVVVCMPNDFKSLYKLLSKEMKRKVIAFKIGIEKGK